MKYYLSALYDKELKEYHVPLCFSNHVMVKRYYEDLLSRYSTSKEHYQNPELERIITHLDNYYVAKLGEFDTETGVLVDGSIKEKLFELEVFAAGVKLSPIAVHTEHNCMTGNKEITISTKSNDK